MLIFRLAAVQGLFVLLVACGVTSRTPDSSQPHPGGEISVEVESHHFSDIVIYLMNGSQSQRLGMVVGLSTASFVLPHRSLQRGGRLQLRAYPVGGPGSFTSEDLLVQPGQGIKWILESDLSRSSVTVH